MFCSEVFLGNNGRPCRHTHTHNFLYSFVGGSTKTPGKTPHVGRVGGSWMFKSNGDQWLFGLEFRLGLHTQGPMRSQRGHPFTWKQRF